MSFSRGERAYAQLLARSYRHYLDAFWHRIEPTRAQIPSVAVEGICAALQAVADGRILRLVIECPPGVGKSKLGPVGFPSWKLLRTLGKARVMAGSYTQTFAERDSMFCRDVINCPEYQELVAILAAEQATSEAREAAQWELRADADVKGDYHTTAGGRRLVVSPTGKTTGERCTTQMVDDVLNAMDATSPAKKKHAKTWVNDALPSRLEDQRSDPRIIIGQPLAVDDPLASVIAKGWKHLRLPVVRRADEPPCVLLDDQGREVWRDTREVGEPLLALLDATGIANLKGDISPSAYRTQYELRRGDDSEATFKRTYWNWYYPTTKLADAPRPPHTDLTRKAVPGPAYFGRIVITADFKFVADVGDYASVQAWGENGPDMYLLKARRGKVGYETSVEWIEAFDELFPGATKGIEKAANGFAVLEVLKKKLRNIKGLKPWGKKTHRHAAAVPTAKDGHCYLPLGEVFEEVEEDGTVTMVDATEFVEELAGATDHDDQMDAASYAILELEIRAPKREAEGGTAIEESIAASQPTSDVEIQNLAALL